MTLTELAELTGTSEADALLFALSIANSIQTDVAHSALKCAPVETVQAYAAHAVKKMDQFVTAYQTNPAGREAFNSSVANMLKARLAAASYAQQVGRANRRSVTPWGEKV